MNALLEKIALGHREALDGLFRECTPSIEALAAQCVTALSQHKKLLFCGNGGSACDAMHIAGEFVGRFVNDRPGLPAIALTADTGILTAVANDYAYDYVFARQVEALGNPGDILIALSTSGRSPNVLKALEAAHKKSVITALFTGAKARDALPKCDFSIIVPSLITAHVQEAHMVALHGLTGLIEAKLFPEI